MSTEKIELEFAQLRRMYEETLKLNAEAAKLHAERDKLYEEREKLRAERNHLDNERGLSRMRLYILLAGAIAGILGGVISLLAKF